MSERGHGRCTFKSSREVGRHLEGLQAAREKTSKKHLEVNVVGGASKNYNDTNSRRRFDHMLFAHLESALDESHTDALITHSGEADVAICAHRIIVVRG